MTWTYSGVPSSCAKDAVRFYVGDTDGGNPMVQDEEIEYILDSEGNVKLAAASICLALAAKFSTACDLTLGDYRVSMAQKSEMFAKRAQELKAQASLVIGIPYAGGISVADKTKAEEDPDRVRPSFMIAMTDFPGTLPAGRNGIVHE